MEFKIGILIAALIAVGWSIICLLIKMQIPAFPWWIVFLPFIFICVILSIWLLVGLAVLIIYLVVGDQFFLDDFDGYYPDEAGYEPADYEPEPKKHKRKK